MKKIEELRNNTLEYIRGHFPVAALDAKVQKRKAYDTITPDMYNMMALHLACYKKAWPKIESLCRSCEGASEQRTIEEVENADVLLCSNKIADHYRMLLSAFRKTDGEQVFDETRKILAKTVPDIFRASEQESIAQYLLCTFEPGHMFFLIYKMWDDGVFAESRVDPPFSACIDCDPFLWSASDNKQQSSVRDLLTKKIGDLVKTEPEFCEAFRRFRNNIRAEAGHKNSRLGTYVSIFMPFCKDELKRTQKQDAVADDEDIVVDFVTPMIIETIAQKGIAPMPILDAEITKEEAEMAVRVSALATGQYDLPSAALSIVIQRLIDHLKEEFTQIAPAEPVVIEKEVVKEIVRDSEEVVELKRKIKDLKALLNEERQKTADLIGILPENAEVRETDEQEKEQSEDPIKQVNAEEMLAAIDQSKIMFVGGHISWIRKMQDVFKEAKFIEPFEYTKISKADFAGKKFIFYNLNFNEHGMYYTTGKLMDDDARITLLHSNNTTLTIKEVYDAVNYPRLNA